MAGVPDVQVQNFEDKSRRHFVRCTIEASINQAAEEQAYIKQRYKNSVRKIGGMDES